MTKSARNLIKTPTVVRVTNVRLVTSNLCVISYLNADKEHVDDLYNVDSKDVVNTLLLVHAGRTVDATLAPDDADGDTHPECTAAVIA